MEEPGFEVELPGFSASYHLPKDPGQMTFVSELYSSYL